MGPEQDRRLGLGRAAVDGANAVDRGLKSAFAHAIAKPFASRNIGLRQGGPVHTPPHLAKSRKLAKVGERSVFTEVHREPQECPAIRQSCRAKPARGMNIASRIWT